MSSLKVIFMGTPAFAAEILEAVASVHQVIQVYCQPPRPTGRGHQVIPCAVHEKANTLGIPVATPVSLKSPCEQEAFRALRADVAVIAAYGLILPRAILSAPSWGCVNIHTSLLPRWRGAAPIQRALMAGDAITGVTLMKMDEGLDTGPILSSQSLEILPHMTFTNLQDALCHLGIDLLLTMLPRYLSGEIALQTQSEEGITYAHKILKEEGLIDWSKPAVDIERSIRALSLWPGASFLHGGERIKVRQAHVVPCPPCFQGRIPYPGEILDQALTVACGKDALQLMDLQKPGGKWMTREAFLNGYSLPVGTCLSPLL